MAPSPTTPKDIPAKDETSNRRDETSTDSKTDPKSDPRIQIEENPDQEWIVYKEPYHNDKGVLMYNEHRVKAEEYDKTAKENGW